MKKSYNPFKMWGSYIGAIIGIFFAPNVGYNVCNSLVDGKYNGVDFGMSNLLSCASSGSPISMIMEVLNGHPNLSPIFYNQLLLKSFLSLISVAIIGFLIGWGIHILFRRFSR